MTTFKKFLKFINIKYKKLIKKYFHIITIYLKYYYKYLIKISRVYGSQFLSQVHQKNIINIVKNWQVFENINITLNDDDRNKIHIINKKLLK